MAWYKGSVRTPGLASQTADRYHCGKPLVPIRWKLVRDPRGQLATQALLCTDPAVDPVRILEWFVLRRQLEVTFQEARARPGVEARRQWSGWANTRTMRAMMGLCFLGWALAMAAALMGKSK